LHFSRLYNNNYNII